MTIPERIAPDEERIVLVAPYEPDPSKWLKQRWYNRYTGRTYQITTEPSRKTLLEQSSRSHPDS